MLIECTIRRARGSSVRFDDTIYLFGPGGGPHVAEVFNPEHIRRLLAVGSSFRVYHETGVTPAVVEPEVDPIEGPVKTPPLMPPPLLPPAASRRRGRPPRVKTTADDQS